VVAGVHYQTDTIASRAVGTLIFNRLIAIPRHWSPSLKGEESGVDSTMKS